MVKRYLIPFCLLACMFILGSSLRQSPSPRRRSRRGGANLRAALQPHDPGSRRAPRRCWCR